MAGGLNMTDAEIEVLLRRVHSGEINVFNLPANVYQKIGAQLSGAVKKGFNLDWDKLPLNSPDWETVRAMQHNTYVFSAAKTFQEINDMTNAVFDSDGMARPFRLFEKDAKKIFDTYNKTWLKTEYATAKEAGRAAKRWNRIQDTADIFPYLEYRTRRDNRVRPEHAEMDGILLPVTDPFWDTHTPPNGWGCSNRCRLIKRRDPEGQQVTELEKVKLDPKEVPDDLTPEVFIRKVKGKKPIQIAPNPKLFNLNFGKEKLVFPDRSKGLGLTSHPYFRVHRRFKTLKDNNFNMPIPSKLAPPITTPKPPVLPSNPAKRLEVAKRQIKKLKPIDQRHAEANQVYQDNLQKLAATKDQINSIIDKYPKAARPANIQKKLDGLRNKFKKQVVKTQDLRTAKGLVQNKYVEDVAEILAQPTSAQIKATATEGVTKNINKSYHIGKNSFNKIVGDRAALRGAEVKATLQGRGRAYYKSWEKTINLSRGERADVVAHELGHFLEDVDKEYFKGVKAFYNRRTKGYPTQRLKDIAGRGYEAWEKTKADQFIDAYTGKIYHDATEITPMFFTHSFKDIHAFIKADPDHFNTIFKLLNTY